MHLHNLLIYPLRVFLRDQPTRECGHFGFCLGLHTRTELSMEVRTVLPRAEHTHVVPISRHTEDPVFLRGTATAPLLKPHHRGPPAILARALLAQAISCSRHLLCVRSVPSFVWLVVQFVSHDRPWARTGSGCQNTICPRLCGGRSSEAPVHHLECGNVG